MKIKTRSKKEYTLTVSKKELQTLQIAVALMWENEYTHEDWIKKLEPILGDLIDALGMENEYGL